MAGNGPLLGKALLEQARKESGLHTSQSDLNPHLTVRNAAGEITGHYYPDGSVKDFNGSLAWLRGIPK